MRVLITGARGQVGHELLCPAPEGILAHGLDSVALVIANAAQVAKVVEDFQPQLIISAPAYTAVDTAVSELGR